MHTCTHTQCFGSTWSFRLRQRCSCCCRVCSSPLAVVLMLRRERSACSGATPNWSIDQCIIPSSDSYMYPYIQMYVNPYPYRTLTFTYSPLCPKTMDWGSNTEVSIKRRNLQDLIELVAKKPQTHICTQTHKRINTQTHKYANAQTHKRINA